MIIARHTSDRQVREAARFKGARRATLQYTLGECNRGEEAWTPLSPFPVNINPQGSASRASDVRPFPGVLGHQ